MANRLGANSHRMTQQRELSNAPTVQARKAFNQAMREEAAREMKRAPPLAVRTTADLLAVYNRAENPAVTCHILAKDIEGREVMNELIDLRKDRVPLTQWYRPCARRADPPPPNGSTTDNLKKALRAKLKPAGYTWDTTSKNLCLDDWGRQMYALGAPTLLVMDSIGNSRSRNYYLTENVAQLVMPGATLAQLMMAARVIAAEMSHLTTVVVWGA